MTIGKKELAKLQELVLPHMHDSMLYRIGLYISPFATKNYFYYKSIYLYQLIIKNLTKV